jgi:uncharacterized protein (TIGR02145 family)
LAISLVNSRRLVILLIGVIGVQTITSCSDDGGGGEGGSSSPSGGNIGNCNGGTVKIGTQTWQKCNLNVVPSTGNSKCYDDDPANCEKYGRLYDWATAMALDTACNLTRCDSQIVYPHRGICPEGWHIPNDADWNKLLSFIDGETRGNGSYEYDGYDSTRYRSYTAGLYLKATSGWNWDKYDNYDGNGTDKYGFSALPGGYGVSGGFADVGEWGYWWNANEDVYDVRYASYRYMGYQYPDVTIVVNGKNRLRSVRCLKD